MKVSTLFAVVTAFIAGAAALPATIPEDEASAAVCSRGYTKYYCLYFRKNNGGSGGSCNEASRIKPDPILYHVCCNSRRIGGGGSWDYVGGCYKV